ncbi:hypothetical protein MNV49_003316 [Pseudohyphozyma bogoriensis]|nr:hypothetical protein MNV49_003316 [Pseudohyphozyma bogoriensis]
MSAMKRTYSSTSLSSDSSATPSLPSTPPTPSTSRFPSPADGAATDSSLLTINAPSSAQKPRTASYTPSTSLVSSPTRPASASLVAAATPYATSAPGSSSHSKSGAAKEAEGGKEEEADLEEGEIAQTPAELWKARALAAEAKLAHVGVLNDFQFSNRARELSFEMFKLNMHKKRLFYGSAAHLSEKIRQEIVRWLDPTQPEVPCDPENIHLCHTYYSMVKKDSSLRAVVVGGDLAYQWLGNNAHPNPTDPNPPPTRNDAGHLNKLLDLPAFNEVSWRKNLSSTERADQDRHMASTVILVDACTGQRGKGFDAYGKDTSALVFGLQLANGTRTV